MEKQGLIGEMYLEFILKALDTLYYTTDFYSIYTLLSPLSSYYIGNPIFIEDISVLNDNITINKNKKHHWNNQNSDQFVD